MDFTTDRVLPLEGVHNFRDCGGYAMSGGGRIRRGMLWRSGQHHSATDSDLAAISGLGLVRVFDLRTSKERGTYPCRRPQGFDADVFYSDDPVHTLAPHIAAARAAQRRTPQSMREGMIRNYEGICFRPELQAMMRLYLARLAEGTGPCLINCMAGKDRTGIAVAMLHLAAGVHRDDVMEDYLLTNTGGDQQARLAWGADTVRPIVGDIDEAVLHVLLGVEPEYLHAAIAAVEERHGSTDAYLAEALGMDAAGREQLRAALA